MTELPQSLAPGCFGKALAFNPTLQECVTCPFLSRCEPEATTERERLQIKLGIKPKGHVRKQQPSAKPASTPTTGATFSKDLPIKVAAMLKSFERAKLKITESLSRGQNPFDKANPVYMRLTCHILLHYTSGVDRTVLRTAMQKKLGYTEATAAALATQAVQALAAVGAIDEYNGKITIRRI